MATFGDIPKFQFFKDDGTLAVGWQLQTFESGTTTPKATFTDVAGTVANPNPVIMDSRGEASILFDGSYKLVLKDDTGATIWTVDDYVADTGSSSGSGTDLVPNGSFETDTTLNGEPDSWTTSAGDTTIRDTSDSIHGVASMNFTSAGTLGGGSIQSENFFEVSAGRNLPISFALKSTAVNVENIVEIFWFDENKIAVTPTKTVILTDNATNPIVWTHKWFNITPVAGAKFAKLKFQGATLAGAVGTTRFDDVVVRGDYSNDQTVGNLTATGNLNGNIMNMVDASFSGEVSLDSTVDSTSPTTGSIHTDGGLGVVKNIIIGGSGSIAGSLDVNSVGTGAIIATSIDLGNGAVTDLDSGTYTPTLTIIGGLSNITSDVAQWLRVGNTVTVSGRFTYVASSLPTTITFSIGLRFASNFTAQSQCSGLLGESSDGTVGTIEANIANNVADASVSVAQNLPHIYHFTYQIL